MYKNLCLNKRLIQSLFSKSRRFDSPLSNSLSNCAPLPHFQYCGFFFGHWGNNATSRAAHDIAQDIAVYANYVVHGLGVVNVLIGQLLRRDLRKSPVGYNDGVLKKPHT